MKAFVVLSLLAVAYAVTNHGLGEITGAATQQIAVTAAYVADGAPTLLTYTTSTSYNSGATPLAIFTVAATGTYIANNTIAALTVTYTNGGDSVVVQAGLTGASDNGDGTFNAVLAGAATPKFLNTGDYTVSSLVYTTSNFKTYPVSLPTGGTATVAATKYTPPTLAAFSLVSPQNLGCDNSGCTGATGFPNGTATLNPLARADLVLTVLGASPVAASAVWYSFSGTSATNVIDFNEDTSARVHAVAGGWVDGQPAFFATQLASATILPLNGALTLSGYIQEDLNFITPVSASTFGGFQASVTSSVGGADITAPTCTVATLAPTTLQTGKIAGEGTITITCADEAGGSGLWTKGAFGTVTTSLGVTTGVSFGPFTTASETFDVYPYISGTLQLSGVWALDNAGNAALYGGCAGVAGYDSLCGAGGSSASTVTLSLVSVVILAILSLFA